MKFSGPTSQPFAIKKGVKQGCVLAAICMFFSMLLWFAFYSDTIGIYTHTRSDGTLYNIGRLRAKIKRYTVMITDLLFADDAALLVHSETELQTLIDRFSNACEKFALTISVKKTVLAQTNRHS